MNAIAINPTTINVIPKPFRGAGTCEYAIFSLIAANPTIATRKPNPDPIAKTDASLMEVKLRCCINKEPPMIAQFTAIKGKKIPKDA